MNRSKDYQDWYQNSYLKQQERDVLLSTLGGITVPPIVSPEIPPAEIGFPGEFPFTRGAQPSMYRGRLWTMRQFAGFGSPEDTNNRFKFLLAQGQTGLSTAFDMPTLMGYDPDHPLSSGEVGKEGVSVCCINDMERLFAGIDQTKVSTSMTINCSAAPVLAMYFALAKRRGADLSKISGTIQNDILKEFIAQKEWISPPRPSVRVVCDMIEFCTNHAQKFYPVSVSGYHIREAGATAVQELAFTLYDGITYAEECVKRGMEIDSFGHMLSFFFDVHNDFFEEICKFRAARRIWSNTMKNRFGAKLAKTCTLKTHAQTAGVSLTAQQPINNVARVTMQALAAILGGTQSLHTNSMDETLSLPTEGAAKVALRTQQIIAEESGVTNVIDPLGGSYYVEWLTDKIENEALTYIKKLDEMGGMLNAIENGFPMREISEASFKFQKDFEKNRRVMVGLNRYIDQEDSVKIPVHKVSDDVERDQIERLTIHKATRNSVLIKEHLAKITNACKNDENIMFNLIPAVDDGVTVGEVSDVFRAVFGVYRDPGIV